MNFILPRNDQISIGDQVIDGKGYILDEPYIARFFDLQSPSRITYSIRCNGYQHNIDSKRFRYCELGCGRGMTAAVLASAYPEAEFVALDLNPEHIAYADALAGQAELENISFVQSDFVEALQNDWEPFDYITVHGVYSWVDKEIREQMFAFLAKYLKEDGVAYVSYNSYPGWAAKEPLWRLLNSHISTIKGTSIERVKSGIEFLDFLVETKAPYFEQNPSAVEHLEYLKSEDLRYISHEFCNEAFSPVYCAEVFDHAAKYGFGFIGQAESCYNIPFEKLPAEYAELVASKETVAEAEVWTSMLRNDQFRTDLFAKTTPEASAIEDTQLWGMAFTNLLPLQKLDPVLECGSSEIDLRGTLESQIVELSETGELRLADLCSVQGLRQYSPKVILQTVQALELSGYFAFMERPCEPVDALHEANWQFSHKSIPVLAKAQIDDNALPWFAAPNLGSGIRMETIDALALLSIDGAIEREAVTSFIHALNDDNPEILGFQVSEEWATGYLYDFREQWGPVLFKLGIMEGQPLP